MKGYRIFAFLMSICLLVSTCNIDIFANTEEEMQDRTELTGAVSDNRTRLDEVVSDNEISQEKEEESKEIGPVDIKSITKYTEQDGWSWDPQTRTLTLAGVNMYGYLPYSYTENPNNEGKMPGSLFDLPNGSTVIVKEGTENILRSKISGDCFCVNTAKYEEGKNGLTITGGGTLQMRLSEIAIFVCGDLVIDNVKLIFYSMDIPIMVSPFWSNTVDMDAKTLIKDSEITIEECTGGLYIYGNYEDMADITEENEPETSTLAIENSRLSIKVKLDEQKERVHNAIAITNGDLKVDHSTISMESYHPALKVWRQYSSQKRSTEDVISMNGVALQEGLSFAGAEYKMRDYNNYIYGQTIIPEGMKTEMSFRFRTIFSDEVEDLQFDQPFSNAVNKAVIKAVHNVTFDTNGEAQIADIQVLDGDTISEFPVLEKENLYLAGWSTNKEATEVDFTENTPVTDHTTLFPVWKEPVAEPSIPEPSTPEPPASEPPASEPSTPTDSSLIEQQESKDSLSEVEKTVLSTDTDKKDPADSAIAKLRLKGTGKNKSVKLSWKKVKGATGYVIYGSKCGTQMKKIKTVSAKKTSYTMKKLKAGKYYKYIVVAVKKENGTEKVLATSKSVHVATTGKKYGNPTNITGLKKSITLKAGKTKKIKPILKSKKKVKTHIAKFRYESSNKKVATVTKKGVIKAKKKGSCTIYVYAQNGLCKTVKVKVK